MRYIFLILLVSCNSQTEKKQISKPSITISDSLSMALDSLKTGLVGLSSVADFAKDAQLKIQQLEKEKAFYESKQPVNLSADYMQYEPSDDSIIDGLKNEIARLKRKIYNDSLYYARIDRVPNVTKEVVYEPEKPNEKSLIINLDKRMQGGEISETGVSVYIMPYDKKAKKLKRYEIYCNPKDVQDAKEANYYQGQYFFNDVKPGKYLIKVCAYYGNYVVIKREDRLQTVDIQISPPIQ